MGFNLIDENFMQQRNNLPIFAYSKSNIIQIQDNKEFAYWNKKPKVLNGKKFPWNGGYFNVSTPDKVAEAITDNDLS